MLPAQSDKLAEFVGILIGDGGVTTYQVGISLGSETDGQFLDYVVNLIQGLFCYAPGITKRKDSNCYVVVISSKTIVDYMVSLGINRGDKLRAGLDIPEWIMHNPEYLKRCIRGVMDTDGCIFAERHRYKQHRYEYPRLTIVSHSPALRKSIAEGLRELGFHPKIRNNRSVHLEDREEIVRYFKVIDSSNPKHTRRYREIMERCVSG